MKHILLVEDDPKIIEIYTPKLRQSGFKVEIVTKGSEVFKKIKEEKPDLLLLDVVLPHLNGWEILRKIKEDEKLKDLKIIVFSNLSQKKEVEKALKLGAEKYLIKAHYTPAELVEEIKEVLKNNF
jgi:DNA-binding response OmpR family regulator